MKSFEEFKLNEASEVDISDLDASNTKTIKTIEKLLNVKANGFWDGIHGVIADFEGKFGSVRIDSKDMKKLSALPMRWFEGKERGITVGLPYNKRK